MKADRGLSIERMVELGRVSRSGFYRFDEDSPSRPDGDMELRDAIHRIALEWPSYGRPRITAELRRQGWTVNPKRVRRLLQEDNLLCIRKRKFVVTTNSNHGCKIYPNLAGKMTPTGVDQLWVADITYVRLQEEFIFLAVILDAYSRRVIGWALDRTMQDDLTLAALRMALTQRSIRPGLVHHSDRGSQYASNEYTDLLKDHGIDISMSRKDKSIRQGLRFILHLLQTADDLLWETTSFGEFDALCLSRWIRSGILIQPVIPIVYWIAAKHAVVAPGDHAFGIDFQSFRHFFECQ